MGDSQPRDSISETAPLRATASKILRLDFESRQLEQERRMEFKTNNNQVYLHHTQWAKLRLIMIT